MIQFLSLNRKYVLTGIKILIGFSIFYYVFRSVFKSQELSEDWLLALYKTFRNGAGLPVAGAFFLIFLNWGVEARKWQYLSGKVEKVSFFRAYRGVLLGISLGFITPNRLGDYAGRIMDLHSNRRLEAIGAIFLGRFCQMLVTAILGSFGILYFVFTYYSKDYPAFSIGLIISFFLGNIIFLLSVIYPGSLLSLVAATPYLRRIKPYIKIIATYSPSEISRFLYLSSLRYAIFVIQFMLLLYAFGVNVVWWQMALGVCCTFLLKSVVPSFTAVTDLGMRELSAMYFFDLLHQDKIPVISASLSLWFLNIALPSLVGFLFVLRVKAKQLNWESKIS